MIRKLEDQASESQESKLKEPAISHHLELERNHVIIKPQASELVKIPINI